MAFTIEGNHTSRFSTALPKDLYFELGTCVIRTYASEYQYDVFEIILDNSWEYCWSLDGIVWNYTNYVIQIPLKKDSYSPRIQIKIRNKKTTPVRNIAFSIKATNSQSGITKTDRVWNPSFVYNVVWKNSTQVKLSGGQLIQALSQPKISGTLSVQLFNQQAKLKGKLFAFAYTNSKMAGKLTVPPHTLMQIILQVEPPTRKYFGSTLIHDAFTDASNPEVVTGESAEIQMTNVNYAFFQWQFKPNPDQLYAPENEFDAIFKFFRTKPLPADSRLEIYLVPNNWSEFAINHSNKPQPIRKIADYTTQANDELAWHDVSLGHFLREYNKQQPFNISLMVKSTVPMELATKEAAIALGAKLEYVYNAYPQHTTKTPLQGTLNIQQSKKRKLRGRIFTRSFYTETKWRCILTVPKTDAQNRFRGEIHILPPYRTKLQGMLQIQTTEKQTKLSGILKVWTNHNARFVGHINILQQQRTGQLTGKLYIMFGKKAKLKSSLVVQLFDRLQRLEGTLRVFGALHSQLNGRLTIPRFFEQPKVKGTLTIPRTYIARISGTVNVDATHFKQTKLRGTLNIELSYRKLMRGTLTVVRNEAITPHSYSFIM